VAPLTSLLVLLVIRWEPSGYDIDGEDYAIESPTQPEPQNAGTAPVGVRKPRIT